MAGAFCRRRRFVGAWHCGGASIPQGTAADRYFRYADGLDRGDTRSTAGGRAHPAAGRYSIPEVPPPPEIQPEFHEEQTPPPQKKIAQKAQPIKAPQVTGPPKPPGMMSASQAKASAISAPRPEYPYEARSRHITGSGVCVVTVDAGSGSVTDASMAQSIGNPILDNSAVSAFKRWRFKPGTVSKVRIPITFTMTGASY